MQELDIQSNGPYWMPLVELERMSIAQKDYSKAAEYFSRLMPILKDIQGETRDPLGYADLLDEYALVLDSEGRAEEAKSHRNRAEQLRATFPDSKPHTKKTPYGKYCREAENP